MCNAERLHGEGTPSRRRCDGDAGHRRIRGSLTRRRPDVGYTLRMNQNRPPINAYHEAGHAVFAWRFRVHLQSVWIRPASTSGGTECDGEYRNPRERAIIYLAEAAIAGGQRPESYCDRIGLFGTT